MTALCFLLIDEVLKMTSLDEILDILLKLVPVFSAMSDALAIFRELLGSPLIHWHSDRCWWLGEEFFFLNMVQNLARSAFRGVY